MTQGGSGPLGRLVGGSVATVAARTFYRVLSGATGERWRRTNHRGEPVTLLEGPAVGAGALVGVLVTPGLPRRLRAAALLAGGAGTALGLYDDLAGTTDAKGLRGHLGALASGELTTGGVKVLGIGAAGLAAGWLARGRRSGLVDTVMAGAVVAGTANLTNLLDLRPGRAAKALLLAGSPMLLGRGAAGDLVISPLSAAVALLPEDLGERSMLGDSGANGLGALVGTAAAAGLPRGPLAAWAVGVVALTLVSERVSFTRVIEGTPALRLLDGLGRRPTSP